MSKKDKIKKMLKEKKKAIRKVMSLMSTPSEDLMDSKFVKLLSDEDIVSAEEFMDTAPHIFKSEKYSKFFGSVLASIFDDYNGNINRYLFKDEEHSLVIMTVKKMDAEACNPDEQCATFFIYKTSVHVFMADRIVSFKEASKYVEKGKLKDGVTVHVFEFIVD